MIKRSATIIKVFRPFVRTAPDVTLFRAAAGCFDRLARMSETTPQRLLASAGDLLGRDQLSVSLGIDRKVLDAWIRGEGTVPSVKLSLLTVALAEFAARKTG